MFNGQSIAEWIQNNVITVLVLVVAAGVIVKALKGEARAAITTSAIVLVACILIGAAPHTEEIGNWAFGLIS